MKRASSVLVLFFSLVLITQCNVISSRENLKNCKFSLEDVQLKNMTFSGLDLGIVVGVENVNPSSVVVDRMDVNLFLDNKEIGKGKTSDKVEIASGEKKEVNFTLNSSYGQLGSALLNNLKGSGEIPYKMVGTAFIEVPLVGEVGFPFSVEDTLKK